MQLKQKKSICLRANNIQLTKKDREFYFFEIKSIKKGTNIKRTIKIKTTHDLVHIANTESTKTLVFYIDQSQNNSDLWEIDGEKDYFKIFNDSKSNQLNVSKEKTPQIHTTKQQTITTEKIKQTPIILQEEITQSLKNYTNEQFQKLKTDFEQENQLLKKEIELLKTEIQIRQPQINTPKENKEPINLLNQEINQKLEILLNQINKKPVLKNTFSKTRNWKSRGFLLIKIFIKKDKLSILKKHKRITIYELKTKTHKQQRTINVQTKLDIYKKGVFCFYIHNKFLNLENWEITDKNNQISFNAI